MQRKITGREKYDAQNLILRHLSQIDYAFAESEGVNRHALEVQVHRIRKLYGA